MRVLVVVSIVALAAQLYAEQRPSHQLLQGTVLDVQKHRVESPAYTIGGSNPSDAPLTSRVYAFDVSVRVDCTTYVGRYESAFNYLPSIFTLSRTIQVRVTRHVMYFPLANDPDMRMGIIRRRNDCAARP